MHLRFFSSVQSTQELSLSPKAASFEGDLGENLVHKKRALLKMQEANQKEQTKWEMQTKTAALRR